MRNRQAPPASRRVFVLFVATTLAPALGLSWLGWRMVEQDRALESQRMQERREHAAGLGAEALQRLLAQMEETLASGSSANAAVLEERMRNTRHSDGGAAIVIFGPEGTLDHAGVPLPYHPAVPPAAEPQASVFAAAESAEFQGAGPAAAIPVLRGLADSEDTAVRSAALVRLARNYRKLGDTAPALAALGDLGKLDQTRVNGSPAGLLARQGRALIFEAAGRREDLRREAALLDADLYAGRWRLTRAHYEFSKEQVRRWLGTAREDTGRLVLAEAAQSVWKQWQSSGRTESEIRERATLRVSGQSVLVLTRGSKDRLTISLIGPRFLESEWLAHLDSLRGPPRINFALTDAEGHPVLGQPDVPLAMQSVRTAAATRLPWTVHAIDAPGGGGMTGRTRMLLGGIAMMAVLVLGGGYLVHRAISREVAVARLQTDFVAAVSHEFRTPLTTMRQLSEMLVHDRVSTEDRRRQFYEVLLRESDRLHRLVEGLLNFGRMEAGKIEYRFEPIDATALVREIVAEFQREASKRGYEVELDSTVAASSIRADRESLSRVFWNLLDNAVKYSPQCRTVWVDLARAGRRIAVRVRDRGMGIPPDEQREIFRKFVRGAGSQAAAVQGTGVGLAIARQIVEAHGGEILVESRPGEGSVFTVLLPCAVEMG